MRREESSKGIHGYLRDAMPGLVIDCDELLPPELLWDLVGCLHLMELLEYIEVAYKLDIAPLDAIPENLASIDRIELFVQPLSPAYHQAVEAPTARWTQLGRAVGLALPVSAAGVAAQASLMPGIDVVRGLRGDHHRLAAAQ